MELFDGRYEQLELLGKGAFSEVWKVRDTDTGRIEALKVYTASTDISDENVVFFKNEFALLADASHPNLLRPRHFAISKPDGYPYLLLKYCKEGSVGKLLGKLSEQEAWRLIRDIASALAYLHSMTPPVIHQDIKPGNILVDGNRYMLSDFGVSTSVKTSLRQQTDSDVNIAGTVAYMAPEKFTQNNMPIMANDIYSLGCTVYELLTGELPFGDHGGLTQNNDTEIPELPDQFSQELRSVIAQCLKAESWERPTDETLVEKAEAELQKWGDFNPPGRTVKPTKPVAATTGGGSEEPESEVSPLPDGNQQQGDNQLPQDDENLKETVAITSPGIDTGINSPIGTGEIEQIGIPSDGDSPEEESDHENTDKPESKVLFVLLAIAGIAAGVAAALFI